MCWRVTPCNLVQWRTEGGFGVFNPPPTPNSESPPKSCQTQLDCENCYKLPYLGHQHTKTFGKKGSKILKLLSVRNCFTLAVTNKLVIINSLKVPKINKILLYEMKFLVPDYRCLQNPWLGGYRSQIPFLSVLKWICWTPPPEQTSWLRHWSGSCYGSIFKRSNCYTAIRGVRGGAVGWCTALQAGRSRVRFPLLSLECFIDIILPAALWPWGWLSY